MNYKVKNTLKTVIFLFASILTFFISPYVIKIISKIKNILFASIIKKSFNKVGNNFYIESPCIIKGGKYIVIGNNFRALSRVRIEAIDFHNGKKYFPKIIIGSNVSLNTDIHIGAINMVSIGDNVLFASRIFITDHYHGLIDQNSIKDAPSDRILYSKGSVIIEDNVWIGEGVIILPNVRIGANSIIGANAVVTKSFPQNSVIAGNPAILIKLLQ